jgi:RNA polymerase sigma-70 factor, ECF subfamily
MTQATWNTTQPAEPAKERSPEQPPTPHCSCATPANTEAFDVIYRQHFSAIAGHLFRRTGNQDLAEDLAADTFLAAWKALPHYQSTGVPIRSWLLRIATNKANALARRDRIRRRVFGRMPVPQPTDKADDVSDWLYPALACLRPQHQSVVSLVHLEGLSIEQVARVLDLPEGTVKSRLHRARAILKHELTRHGDHQ